MAFNGLAPWSEDVPKVDFDVRAAGTLEGVARHSGSEFVVDLGDIQ
ncbi:hypothetical protein [Amycolatopsis magusensis]